MQPYMFVINAVPMPENIDCSDIAGAKIHIWVIADNKDHARNRAIGQISEYLWQIINFEHEFEIQPEQIPRFHEDEIRLYNKALQFGVAADYIAYPKKPGNSDEPVVKRPL